MSDVKNEIIKVIQKHLDKLKFISPLAISKIKSGNFDIAYIQTSFYGSNTCNRSFHNMALKNTDNNKIFIIIDRYDFCNPETGYRSSEDQSFSNDLIPILKSKASKEYFDNFKISTYSLFDEAYKKTPGPEFYFPKNSSFKESLSITVDTTYSIPVIVCKIRGFSDDAQFAFHIFNKNLEKLLEYFPNRIVADSCANFKSEYKRRISELDFMIADHKRYITMYTEERNQLIKKCGNVDFDERLNELFGEDKLNAKRLLKEI